MTRRAIRWTALGGAVVGLLLSRPADGTADPALASSLPWLFNGAVHAAARLGDTLYVGGAFSAVAPSANALPPLWAISETTGAVASPAFPSFDGDVAAVEPDGAGGFFVGGGFTRVAGASQPYLAHVGADGAFDAAFRPDVDGPIAHMALLGSTLYLHGSFPRVGGVTSFSWGAVASGSGAMVAWRPMFASVGISPGVMLAADGRIVIGGTDGQSMATSGLVAAFDPMSGMEAWRTAVTPGGVRRPRGTVTAMVHAGGRLIVGHTASTTNGGRGLSALTPSTGALDPSWTARAAEATSLVVSGSSLYVGGAFSEIDGQPRPGAAAFDVNTAALLSWSPSLTAVDVLAPAPGGGVYVTAIPPGSDALPRRRLARVDANGVTSAWTSDPRPERVVAMKPGAAGTQVVVSGIAASGTVARAGLAAFDLPSGALLPWAPPADGAVAVMGISSSRVTVAGWFTSLSGQAAAGAAAIDPTSGALLAWSPSTPGAATFTDDRWLYWSAGSSPSGPFTLERYGLSTGVRDASWQGPASSAAPRGAAFDATTLFVASEAGLTALDRTTARVRWHHPASTRMVAITGDTLYSDSGGFTLSTLDSRSGRLLSSRASVAATGLGIADGRLIVGGSDPNVLRSGGLYGVTLDTRTTVWSPALTQTLSGGLFSLTGGAPTFLAVSGGRLIAGGTFGTRAPGALQGLAAFTLAGANAPAALRARPNGDATEFRWDPPATAPAGGYVLEAGLASGETIARLPLGDVTRFSIVVPPGAFYARVRTSGAVGGTEEVSNEILVTGGCTAVPPPPTGFSAVLLGTSLDRVRFSWAAPDAFVSSYTLAAGSAPGLTDIASIPLSGVSPSLVYASAIPPGTYFVRVRAANSCGQSPFTPDLRLTIGAGSDLPLAPLNLTATTTGNTTTLSWVVPPGAISGHVLEAGSDTGLADLVTAPLGPAPGLVVPGVPSGVYVLRVRAVNAAGTGPPSADVVLRVP